MKLKWIEVSPYGTPVEWVLGREGSSYLLRQEAREGIKVVFNADADGQ